MDSTAVSIFVVLLVELTNTIVVNSTNTTTNIETAVLSRHQMLVEARNIREQGWRVAGGLSQARGSVMNMEIVSAHLHTSLLYPLYEEINHASSTLLNFLLLH